MGLLDYFDPDTLRGKLKGLLGGMPISQMAQGRADFSGGGLKDALMGMPVGPDPAAAYDAAMAMGPLVAGMTKWEKAHKVAQKNATEMLGLPPNNTAMDRARAMGFETSPSKQVYHGARGEIDGPINPSRSDFGFHVGSLQQAEDRLKAFGVGGVNFPEGANVLQLLKNRYSNMLRVKDEGSFHADALAPQLEKRRILAKGKGKQIKQAVEADWRKAAEYDAQMRAAIDQAGYDGISYSNAQETPGVSYAFSNPAMLRSRFAAFDPKRKHEADLLAGYFGLPMPQYQQD